MELKVSKQITVEAHLTATSLIQPPRYYGHFFLAALHRRTGNFLPEGGSKLLPKKFSQVAQIFTKQ